MAHAPATAPQTPARARAPAPPCAPCRRLRQALLLLAGLGLLLRPIGGTGAAPAASAASAPTAASAPLAAAGPSAAAAPAAGPASAPAAPATAATAVTAAASVPTLQWVYRTVALPAGRVDQDYVPRSLLRGGQPALQVGLVEGSSLPPGLLLDSGGLLTGLPTRPGVYRFVIEARDASMPPQLTQQAYVLRVDPAARRGAASAPAAAPPVMSAVPQADAEATLGQTRSGRAGFYRLLPSHLPRWAPAEAASAPAAAASAGTTPNAGTNTGTNPPPALAVPSFEQLQDMLTPLLDIEYPTRELFERALDAQRCNFFLTLARESAARQNLPLRTGCPPAAAGAAGAASAAAARAASAPAAAASAAVPLATLYAELLPAGLRDDIVLTAQSPQDLNLAPSLHLRGDDCGCAPQGRDDETFALLPFWLGGPDALTLNFELYSRLSYFGAQLMDDGQVALAPDWNSRAPDFVRLAHRYGAAVDLLVYRRDWTRLQARAGDAEAFDQSVRDDAARVAQLIAEAPPYGWLQPERYLLPFWRPPAQLYSGLTLFFEPPPGDAGAPTAASAALLKRYWTGFVLALTAALQQDGRALALNLVVPDSQLGDRGIYDFKALSQAIHHAEMPPRLTASDRSDRDMVYGGTTPIRVHVLVLMGEPMADAMKSLRERIDQTPHLEGHARVAMLNAIVPVLFHARGAKAATLGAQQTKALSHSLQYFKWNYGGVGLWPPTQAATGTGAVVAGLIDEVYNSPYAGPADGVCRWICPWRIQLRLLFQLLAGLTLLGLGAYAASCQLRHLGRPVLLALWIAGLAALLCGGGLLSCDPDLERLRDSNALLYGLLAALFAAGAYSTLKPKVELP